MEDAMMSAACGQGQGSGFSVRISVIVPVFNRPRQLQGLLEAISSQNLSKDQFEVLVCDDGSSDRLGPLVDDAARRFGLQATHARQSRGGAGRARNLGISLACGEILAFTDSDCLPDPGWLSEISRAFSDPTVGLAGGLVEGRGARSVSGRCVGFLMSSTLGSGGARDPRGLVHMDYYPRTCNLAVRRDLARAVGGFPASTHGEDLEFSHQVREANAGVRFLPDAIVVHDERRTIPRVAFEAFLKGRTRVHLARRLAMHQLIHAVPAMFVIYLALLTVSLSIEGLASPLVIAPSLAYMAALASLALHGFMAVGGADVLLLIPAFAAAMHLGYGVGYLSALPELFRRPRPPGLLAVQRSVPGEVLVVDNGTGPGGEGFT